MKKGFFGTAVEPAGTPTPFTNGSHCQLADPVKMPSKIPLFHDMVLFLTFTSEATYVVAERLEALRCARVIMIVTYDGEN